MYIYMYTCIYIYIFMYMYKSRYSTSLGLAGPSTVLAAQGFMGFLSSFWWTIMTGIVEKNMGTTIYCLVFKVTIGRILGLY